MNESGIGKEPLWKGALVAILSVFAIYLGLLGYTQGALVMLSAPFILLGKLIVLILEGVFSLPYLEQLYSLIPKGENQLLNLLLGYYLVFGVLLFILGFSSGAVVGGIQRLTYVYRNERQKALTEKRLKPYLEEQFDRALLEAKRDFINKEAYTDKRFEELAKRVSSKN